jgi:hypothetical protein
VVAQRARDRYSMDAGIEWSGWLLISDPLLTSDTQFTDVPLQPLPADVNGQPFPATEIRYVPGAGAVESQQPEWTGSSGDTCYVVQASESGTLSVRLTTDAGEVWLALLDDADPCVRPPGGGLTGGSPYGADFDLPAAGTYQLLVGIDTPDTGTIDLSVPAATYEVRSTIGQRNTVARLIAGYSGLRVVSWQLN